MANEKRSGVLLTKLLSRRSEVRQVLDEVLRGAEEPVCVRSIAGDLLYGPEGDLTSQDCPILYEGDVLGWAYGGRQAGAAADLLSYAAGQEGQKKSLAGELLERYRELTLLYHLSEHLAASPEPEAIASAALEEAMRAIPATAGWLFLRISGGSEARTAAFRGDGRELLVPCGLIEQVMQSGKAALANSIPSETYFSGSSGQPVSLMCAPLKTEQQVLGALLLANDGLSGDPLREFTAGELKLLNAIGLQAAPAMEISRLYKVAIENARIQQELDMARQVQESLLPAHLPQMAGWSFDKRWLPARVVSGDFYDLVQEGSRQLGLVIADITDKGMPASLFMVFVRSALRASMGGDISPAEAVTHANAQVCQDSHQGLFATLVYARLYADSGEVRYVNAGHNPPLLYSARTNQFTQLTRTGLPLGIFMNMGYKDQSVHLEPGDFLLFYTDGVTEANNAEKNEFGLERLQQALFDFRFRPAAEMLEGVQQRLADYVGQPSHLSDDVTLMLVKRDEDMSI